MTDNKNSAKWWNGLDSAEKTKIVDTNTYIVGKCRRWETLNSTEIFELYQIINVTT